MKKSMQIRAVLVAAAAVACTYGTVAQAVDQRSWDQKINDPANRYVVLSSFNSQAVLDKETQLVWHRAATSSAVTWVNAVNICLSSGIGGRQGWRLPSLSELSALLGTGGTLPTGHPFTGVPNTTFFWSSTRDVDTTRAYARQLAYLDPIYIYRAPKTFTYRVLCVRGQGAADGY